ncbi:transcription antitermination factor NusB [Johnsonella ignava ATCC 51276]|uniref:Transcription antitermination protein NusB n=1 Tax=Johnsonella ignava ATCC 51276 TaxID=679200 RepID=G5GFQ1_9FIRM|nr:transcription antitermination factor NusB [Johnsonella ignava]EHI56528.1 transcription antitermination factor NusB [Johnsonella ignava ATCC 51276]
MSRRKLRENYFKILFCSYFHSDNELHEQIKLFMENEENRYSQKKETEKEYSEKECSEKKHSEKKEEVRHTRAEDDGGFNEFCLRLKDIKERCNDIDRAISSVSKGWKLDRMGKVELTILRLAVYEMEYDDSIPKKVAVNEAVELAKRFGGDDSPAFVNGILAKLI